MKRALWGLALVSVLLTVGMASAQTAPAGTTVAAPAKAVPAPVKTAAASAKVDLAQIFAAPAAEGNSTKAIALTPEPLWKNWRRSKWVPGPLRAGLPGPGVRHQVRQLRAA